MADSVGMGLYILSQDGVSVGGCTWECVCLFGCVLWEQALHTVNTKKTGRCISRVIETYSIRMCSISLRPSLEGIL